MAALGRRRPHAGWAAHRRGRIFYVLTTLARVAFGGDNDRAGEVCGRVPCAAGSHLCLRLYVLLPRRSSSHGAVSDIGWELPSGLGGGWVFVPSPRPRPSYPSRDWDAVGAPRVLTPLDPPASLGVESSHDDSTPPPFVCGVESSCHDSTPPLPPSGVESSWDD